jgi:hypothetical protein
LAPGLDPKEVAITFFQFGLLYDEQQKNEIELKTMDKHNVF